MKSEYSKQDWTVFFSPTEQLAIDNLELVADNIELRREIETLNRKLDRMHANMYLNAKVELMNKIFQYRVKWVDSEWWGVVVTVNSEGVESYQITDPNGKPLCVDDPMHGKLTDTIKRVNGGGHGN